MQYRNLGNSGAVVSHLCLGTMTFGAESDEATSVALMNDYVEAGGNFLDRCANSPPGQSNSPEETRP